MKNILYIMVSTVLMLLFNSCAKETINESELITSLYLTLQPENGGAPVHFSFFDPDGDGGVEPLITEEALMRNTTYHASIVLLDESKIPADTLNPVIINEAIDHQFFYTISEAIDLKIEYEDEDANGNPLGIKTKFIAGVVSGSSLVLTLRHQPDKLAAGVKAGDITNAGGETDIEVIFTLNIR